ncbi:single-stranded DNA-binding protein [Nocardioides lijunqiniae]|uniref:single-stranded DNA-binding protein n=1 Tax=Nocardioides lijunqiniae TaxID=2760832 RepID=UPI0018787A12|nr:single-stranded DNA-binding protein [Nocardioides lijunqiniae]
MSTTTVTFAGNLTSDPELRFTPSGTPVAEFRVLVNRRTKDRETNEYHDAEPTGHNCKVWGKKAENLAESLTSGARVVVHGHVETEAWTDKDTQAKRTRDVVIVDEIGPSLKYATAKVTNNTKTTTQQD